MMVAKLDSKSQNSSGHDEVQVQVQIEPASTRQMQTSSTEVMVQTAFTEHESSYQRNSGTEKDKSSGKGLCGFMRRLLKIKTNKRKDKKHLSLQELQEAEILLQRSSSLMATQGVQWRGTPFCTQSFVFPTNDHGIWGPPELPPHPQRVPAELHWLLGTLPRRREYELCAPGGGFFPPPADDVLRLGGGERAEPPPTTTTAPFDDDLEERFGWFYDRPPPSAFRRQGWPTQPSAPQMPPYEPYLHYCLGNLPPRSPDSEVEDAGAGEGEGGSGGGRVHASAGTTRIRTVPAGSPTRGRSSGGSSGGAAHALSSSHVTSAQSQDEQQPESAQRSPRLAGSPRRVARSAFRRSARIGSAWRRNSARRRRTATIAPGAKAHGPMASAAAAVAVSPTGRPRGTESAEGGSGGSAGVVAQKGEKEQKEEMEVPNAMVPAPSTASQLWLAARRSLESKSPRIVGLRPVSSRRRRPSAPIPSARGPRGLGALVAAARSPVRVGRRKEEMTAPIVPHSVMSQTDSKEKLSPQSWDSVVTIRYPRRHRVAAGSSRRRVVGQMGSQRDLECLVELSTEELSTSSACQPTSAGEGSSRFTRGKDTRSLQLPRSVFPRTMEQRDAPITSRSQAEPGTSEAAVSRPRTACGDYKQ